MWYCQAGADGVAPIRRKLSGSVTPAIRSNFGETGLCASKLASSSRVSRVGAAAGLLRGLRGGARGGAEVPATRGPIWRSVRCAATARDPTPPRRSPSWHGPRHCGRRYRSTVTSGRGAPASAMMIAPAASPTRRPRAWWLPRVWADQEVYQGLSDAARTRGRVDVTTRGYRGDPNDRFNDDSDPPDVRRRGQGQYLGACARWRGRRSRCSSAPPSHCAWPPGPPVQAVHCHTRAGRSAVLARWRLRFAQQALSALCG